MAFFIVVKGRLTPYEFPYLDSKAPIRMNATRIPGAPGAKGKNKTEIEASAKEVFAIDVMTSSPLTLSPASRIRDVQLLMETHKIHHVPLLIDKKLCGLISKSDLLQQHPDDEVRSDKIMSKLVLVASEGVPLRQIAEVFMRENINSMPVVDNDLLLTGIITHRDILRWVLENGKLQK